MRRLTMALLLATSYGGAATAAPCVHPIEQQAFNVIGLKSALMVAALSCSQRDQYDTFMTTFQPHILAEQHVMDGYFRRAGGRYGQSREDDYVTLLANSQSETGINQGAVTCQNDLAIFQRVLALKTTADLDQYATANPTAQPVSMTACTLGHHLYRHHRVHPLTVADAQTTSSHSN